MECADRCCVRRGERAICAQPVRAMGATLRMRRLPIN